MQKVYLVMYWNYSDSSVVGIFSDCDKAEQFCAVTPNGPMYSIEEYALDEKLNDVKGESVLYRAFQCFQFSNDGQIAATSREMASIKERMTVCCVGDYGRFAVWVCDSIEEHRAKKIAIEKFQEFVRLKGLGCPKEMAIQLINRDQESLAKYISWEKTAISH